MTITDNLMIGTLAGGTAGMTALKDIIGTNLGIRTKAFDVAPVHFSRYVMLGDGSVVGRGWKQTEWHLNGIRHSHWNVLYTTYRVAHSTSLYIRTYMEDGKTFANYLANMIWSEEPITREHDTNAVLNFTLKFIQLVEQP